MDWSHLLPRVEREYTGARASMWFLALVAAMGTFRGLVHMLARDGGAQSIAGLDVAVEGGINIIAVFGQWGASQLILTLLHWLTVVRFRFLLPLMLATVVLEHALRIAIGLLKPLQVAAAPPGAYGSYVLLPLSAVAFVLSLRRRE